jgi:hypothetical protein
MMKNQFSSMQSTLADQQKTQLAALQTQFQQQYDAYQEKTKVLHDHVKAHDGRIGILEDQQSKATSKLNDLTSRVAQLESWIQSSATPASQPAPPPPTLSFPSQVSTDLAARIEKAREFQAANLNSFVIFKAKDHIAPDQEPEVFAQLVANLFGGPTASVDSVSWIGIERNHLKINLTLPLAEDIGSKFWQDRQALHAKYFLAPCRSKLLRDAMHRMRVTINATRNLRPELHVQRVSATSVRFLGSDKFDAMDFLYPAIRLHDGRVIPVSHIVNTPNIASIPLNTDPSLPIPDPQPGL